MKSVKEENLNVKVKNSYFKNKYNKFAHHLLLKINNLKECCDST